MQCHSGCARRIRNYAYWKRAKAVTRGAVEQALETQSRIRTQKLGEILTDQKVISRKQLHNALEHERALPVAKLGSVLLEMKLINQEQLDSALESQQINRKKSLGEILLALGFLTQEQLNQALSQKLGIPVVDLTQFNIDPAAIRMLPNEFVGKYQVMPLCLERDSLVLAMTDPLDHDLIERVRFSHRRK